MATTYELANRAEAKNAKRYGDVPLGAVIRGDERYNRPGLFNGPRGWDYWNRLEGPGAYQNPNLWPDKRPTYFWARMGWGPADSPSAEGPGYTVEGRLADGTLLSGEQVVGRFSRPGIDLPPQVDAEMWYGLVNAQDNDPRLEAETTPARADSQWENFYGMKYTVVGAFKGPKAREKMGLPRAMEAGGDPTTQYMVLFTHRKFGPLHVLRGKMPTFPATFSGTKTMPGGQVQYWSNTTVGSGPSGEVWDGLSDMQAPLDADGYYTIVVSRPEDRPANATEENGVAWMDWGPGEGLDDDRRNRKDFGMMIMRFMACDPGWENSPTKATTPGTEAKLMGPYYPTGYYTTKEAFEADGPKK
jgi:hypothetical protein